MAVRLPGSDHLAGWPRLLDTEATDSETPATVRRYGSSNALAPQPPRISKTGVPSNSPQEAPETPHFVNKVWALQHADSRKDRFARAETPAK